MAADGARSPGALLASPRALASAQLPWAARCLRLSAGVPDFLPPQSQRPRMDVCCKCIPQLRSFIMSVDGVNEFAFHTRVPDGVDGDTLTEADAAAVSVPGQRPQYSIDIPVHRHRLAGHAPGGCGIPEAACFLGGDAAYLFTPTGGLGYNTAVEDAVNRMEAGGRAQGGGRLPPCLTAALERSPALPAIPAMRVALPIPLACFDAVPELDGRHPRGVLRPAPWPAVSERHVRASSTSPASPLAGATTTRLIVGDGSSRHCQQVWPTALSGRAPAACVAARWPSDPDWTLLVLGCPTRREGRSANGRPGLTRCGCCPMACACSRSASTAVPDPPDHIICLAGNFADGTVMETVGGRAIAPDL